MLAEPSTLAPKVPSWATEGNGEESRQTRGVSPMATDPVLLMTLQRGIASCQAPDQRCLWKWGGTLQARHTGPTTSPVLSLEKRP